MELLSTNAIAKQWGVSTRRVTILASQGRIDGTRQIDGRWYFPENAQKPVDARRRGAKAEDISGRYVFPFILCSVSSREQVSRFSAEERMLYRLCLLYEAGEFHEARSAAEELLQGSENPYIRLGALYLLPAVCLYVQEYEAVDRYTRLFLSACDAIRDHRNELDLLRDAFHAEMIGISDCDWAKTIKNVFPCDNRFLPYAAMEKLMMEVSKKLLTEVSKSSADNQMPDIAGHEIICQLIETEGYHYCAMMMHVYISICYTALRDREGEYRHMKQALALGVEHNMLFSLSPVMTFHLDSVNEIVREYPPETAERFRALSDVFNRSRDGYCRYRGKEPISSRLKKEELSLITCCLKNYSIEQMAEVFGLTRSGLNKRLAALYTKLEVGSKNEMVRLYIGSVLDWTKGIV